MRSSTLVRRSLLHFRHTNLAVVLGVATAVAVLAGALLTGASVRASLRDLALQRIGATDQALSSSRFFREALGGDLAGTAPGVGAVCPLVILPGVVTEEASGRRATGVAIYGVDERFWSFHARQAPSAGARDAFASAPLARELRAAAGATLLVRVEQPEDVPAASLFGRRDNLGRTLRVRLEGTRAAAELGEFALHPKQGDVFALFVPLRLLQRTLRQPERANTLLIAADASARTPLAGEALGQALARAARIEDVGLKLRPLPGHGALALERDTALLDDALVERARRAAPAGVEVHPVLTYLADSIEANGRSVPYSLVSGLDPEGLASLPSAAAVGGESARPRLLLNDWTARELAARPGDTIVLAYDVWEEQGRLAKRRAEFELAGVVPLEGAAADPDLTPQFPGITDSVHLSDWDPPFPIDLRRIRPQDETYWESHRTTPKAFVALDHGQELWGHRLGRVTSLRFVPAANAAGVAALSRELEARLRAAIDPLQLGFELQPVRERALAAARGSTDFGEYFTYFSAFLLAAALLLAALFFRLGVEQRLTEIGRLRAVGFSIGAVRRLFLAEGAVLAVLGGILGMAAAAGYAALIMWALRTVWVDAVGTRALTLHVSLESLLAGAAAGVATAILCIAVTLRGLTRLSPRGLIAGERPATDRRGRARRPLILAAAALGALAGLLLWLAHAGRLGQAGAFFGAGLLLLAALLVSVRAALIPAAASGIDAPPLAGGLVALGLRQAAERPGRSVLCVALIAAASFIVIATGAFRREVGDTDEPGSGTGGYALTAQSLLPLYHDLSTAEGRAAQGLEPAALAGASLTPFRLRPGDDASCLNLYRPQEPALLGAPPAFLRAGRFRFQAALAQTPEQRANPWLLLEQDLPGGAVPVVADATSLRYVLHRELGDEIRLERPGASPVTLRIVAALLDSLFQGELVTSERHLLRAFPELSGYRFFLIDAPRAGRESVAQELERSLADWGFDARSAAERLDGFHRIENTYLATFQALGGFGVLLGTLGLATVLLRNALERRRELAVLRAVGYRSGDIRTVVLAENALLLVVGLSSGALAAMLAIAPAALARGTALPIAALLIWLSSILATGLFASLLAATSVARWPLLSSLRSE